MAKRMLIDALHTEETRVVIADENQVYDFDFVSTAKKQLKGNIYLAKITRVEPSLQAAFVEYGGGKQGFLAGNDVHEAVIGEPGGPGFGDNGEELKGDVPVRGEILAHRLRQRGGEIDVGAGGFIEQFGQFLGQRPGTVGLAGGAVAAAHGEDEFA